MKRLQMEQRRGHLGALVVWTALVGLCWQASAQIPRPPMPIPVVPAPIAIRPPVIAPIPAPTPPARPAPTLVAVPSPFPVALPPPEFDHDYKGQLVVTKWNDYSLIQLICKDTPNAVACSYQTHDPVSGRLISCLIMLGPIAHNDERVMQHEMGHCNGWSNNHERARYGD